MSDRMQHNQRKNNFRIYNPTPAHLCFSFLTSTLGFLRAGGLESEESFLMKGNICLILKEIHSQQSDNTKAKRTAHRAVGGTKPQPAVTPTASQHLSHWWLANLSLSASSECFFGTLLCDESFLQRSNTKNQLFTNKLSASGDSGMIRVCDDISPN